MNRTKFSLIIPYLNSELFINNCLESISAQNYSTELFEVIFVDDGSSDSSRELIEKFSNISIVESMSKNVSKARNFGRSKASGEFLIFLDSNVVFENDLLQKINNLLDVKSIDILQLTIRPAYFNEVTNSFEYMLRQRGRVTGGTFNTMSVGYSGLPVLDTAGLLVRADCFDLLKGFDERLRRYGDRDFGFRALSNKCKLHAELKLEIKKYYDIKSLVRVIRDNLEDYYLSLKSIKFNSEISTRPSLKLKLINIISYLLSIKNLKNVRSVRYFLFHTLSFVENIGKLVIFVYSLLTCLALRKNQNSEIEKIFIFEEKEYMISKDVIWWSIDEEIMLKKYSHNKEIVRIDGLLKELWIAATTSLSSDISKLIDEMIKEFAVDEIRAKSIINEFIELLIRKDYLLAKV